MTAKRTIAHTVLDQIVARDPNTPRPPHVDSLRFQPIDGWEPGRVWGTWEVDKSFYHGMGAVFGGYIAAIADNYLSLAMWSTMSDDEVFTTSDLRVSYFRPVVDGKLEIVAEVVNRGRRLAHVEATFVDERGKVCAKATATEVIMPMAQVEPSGSGG